VVSSKKKHLVRSDTLGHFQESCVKDKQKKPSFVVSKYILCFFDRQKKNITMPMHAAPLGYDTAPAYLGQANYNSTSGQAGGARMVPTMARSAPPASMIRQIVPAAGTRQVQRVQRARAENNDAMSPNADVSSLFNSALNELVNTSSSSTTALKQETVAWLASIVALLAAIVFCLFTQLILTIVQMARKS
jgi:hypothetical protein